MAHCQKWFYYPNLISYMTKHTKITNYNDGDDDKYDDGNDNENVTSLSVSDGLIFDLITTPRSRRGGMGDDG